MAEADISPRDSSSEDLEVDPTPELVIINSSSNYKVGQKVTLELRHLMPQQQVELNVTPDGVDIEYTTNLMGPTEGKRYILVPRKYGGYKVTVDIKEPAEDDDANRSINAVFIHVIPMGELKLRVTGLPQQVQLPRDVLVDKSDLIVADGIRRRVIRVSMVQESEQEEYMVPSENFSPIGLAMKRDTTSEENNELYVTDLTNACVHVFHGPHKLLESFGKNVLKRPTGIAIDDDGFIFVADHEAKRIFQFSPDYELIKDDTPHLLSGPQLMTIHKTVSSFGAESSTLLVANRTESKVSLFNIQQPTQGEPYKKLVHITDLKIDIDALSFKFVMPFSVACDLDGHIFIAGQVMTQNGERKGFIWFKDKNSSLFGGSKMIDWSFGGGLRNPGGMRIVEEVDGRYLYITDMRGKNANNCINKYLL